MSRDIEQGTQEWRAARIGKITGSRIGGILGVSPFTSRKRVMREMAEEMQGNMTELSGPQLQWGKDHEDVAAKQYDFLYAGSDIVTTTGFWEKGDLGASPDRLVGAEGLLEVKCPYGMREDKVPHFKSIFEDDMKHYYHQVQMQLYVTDRQWCDFFQWTPNGHELERVKRDMDWYRVYEDEFVTFMGELDDLMGKVKAGGSEERVALSARWGAAAESFRLAKASMEDYKKMMDEAKATMIELMEASEIDHCEGAGIRLQRIAKKGSVDYKAMSIEQLTEEVVKPLEEQYRRSGSASWTIKEIDSE